MYPQRCIACTKVNARNVARLARVEMDVWRRRPNCGAVLPHGYRRRGRQPPTTAVCQALRKASCP